MQPELERDDQVVARVVAWHNRHPLATRIRPDQVHSVGVVSLPFAVPGAALQTLPVPPAVVAPAPEVAAAAPTEPAVDGPPPAGDADVELAIETDELAGPEPADAPTLVEPRPDAAAGLPEAAHASSGDLPVAEASTDAPPAPALAADASLAESVPATIAILPALTRSWHPLTWWRRWRGEDSRRLALFTEDFIAPLSPRRVARWAAVHGQGTPPLAAGAPRRRVVTDARRASSGQGAPEVELHVITAAVGVGDQRLRLLLGAGPRGAVLGPRHWSRARVAVAGALLAALVLPMAALPWWLAGDGNVAVAQAASSPLSAASAASAAATEASAVAAAALSEGEVVLATVSAASAASAPQAASDAMMAAARAAEAAPPAPPPVDVTPRRGRIELDPLVARLPDDERQALRRSGRDLRGEPALAASDKAWALVTAPLDQRRAERAAAQLKAVALFQRLPMQVEQLPAGARWRAVFWPFTSAADAEKVRLALADKGLQTEVLEF